MSDVDGSAGGSPLEAQVAVVGLGYVGLTLAVVLANAGVRTLGIEANAQVAEAVHAGRPPFFEPGLAPALASDAGQRLTVRTEIPERLPPIVVICVGTPIDAASREPDLTAFDAAVAQVAAAIQPDTLVVVRSTVPVGTARARVLPALAARVPHPLLAVCPERTIQGRALTELAELPQVVGGLDHESASRADALFAMITPHRTLVSSLEAAELVKLVNNAHTDVIYGFGNEVAVMAAALGLDADEVIDAANVGYPRPDLSRPGFVGGSCLTKDPYLLRHSLAPFGVQPRLAAAAREVNEAVPGQVADRVTEALRHAGVALREAKVLVCGIAYKGRPATDDVRGAASVDIAARLRGRVRALVGHDFLVSPERIARLGLVPTSLAEGLDGAHAAVLLVDHPGYADLDVSTVAARMRHPAVVFDMWGLLRAEFEGSDKVTYLRWGRG